MPIPSPNNKQSREDFVCSCMSNDVMNEEFPEERRRAAVCYSKYRHSKGGEIRWETFQEEIENDSYIYRLDLS